MFDRYMRLLRRLFGDTGALSAYLILRRVGLWLAVLGSCALAAFAVYFLVPENVALDHERFETARVDRLEVLDGDARFGVVANVTLPNGTTLRLVASEGRIAQSVTETACVEVQRNPETDQLHYRLTHLSDC
ncbi:MAG: hypothetical protein AB3N13_00170 [Arenibacterium sp.]